LTNYNLDVSQEKKKFVFLDRDGVINQQVGEANERAPRNLDELAVFPDAIAELPKLAKLGYELIVITNQPDVARKTNSIQNVAEINDSIQQKIPSLKQFKVCPHDDADNCFCRKPKSGMILEELQKVSFDPSNCWVIGDRLTDISAGAGAGIRTILLNRSPDPIIFDLNQIEPNFIVFNLQQAIEIIISEGC